MKILKITVYGLVQGIGYRPFVAELAEEVGIIGQVKNLGGIVEIYASGNKEALDKFVERLNAFYPTGARVDAVLVNEVYDSSLKEKEADLSEEVIDLVKYMKELEALGEFRIVQSTEAEQEIVFVPADIATCKVCQDEMRNPYDRRYRHPFISCVSCGPRFSIMERLPYDRDTITMKDFEMCEDCRKEYTEKGNVRRHAQTIACPNCGPKLRLVEKYTDIITKLVDHSLEGMSQEKMIDNAIALLREGKIGAIKDIGGFHFAFLPTLDEPAERLREFKNREMKPFAVMFANVEQIKEYCQVSMEEEDILTSDARPIVLLKKRKDDLSRVNEFSVNICGESDRIGAMLPCNPIQIMLVEELGPLVMTSGNRGGEPIITEDGPMEELLKSYESAIDFMLTHNRKILTPLEDSILQVSDVVQILRRGRGYVPEPITIPATLEKECLAAGGDLKAVFALCKHNKVYMSSHFGDLSDYRAMKKREESIQHMERLLGIHPKNVIGDLHPLYVSADKTNLKVQHHHAHALSVMAEHGFEQALGISFDGTGFGTDGNIWGSEFLLCKRDQFRRLAHLKRVAMIASDEAARDARISLLAYLMDAVKEGYIREDEVLKYSRRCKIKDAEVEVFKKKIEYKLGVVSSTSMGRLFDAVSAILDIKNYNSYEGECAISLEMAAHRAIEEGKEKIRLRKITDPTQMVMELLKRKYEGYDCDALALAFHENVAEFVMDKVTRLLIDDRITREIPIVLSGGTFCNRILLHLCMEGLRESGFQVYTNEKVPCGDGGLALGQAYAIALSNGN